MSDKPIEIDWEYFLRTGSFVKKGEAPVGDDLVWNKKTIDDLLTLCRADSKLESRYKFIEIYGKVRDLFGGDDARACAWLITKNSYYFNKAPLEIIATNNAKVVLTFLNEKLGKS